MKFEDYNFHPKLIEGIHLSGFKRPTDIQYKAISHILRGEDLLAVAQTGTGKTAAFVIPILHRLQSAIEKERRKDGIKCIVLVPTHELAIQVSEVFKQIGKKLKVNTLGIFGGVDQEPQIKSLNKRVDILVATPGRMFDLISQGHLLVHRVETLVLDESDHMLKLGFLKDIFDLIKKLPKRRQTLFFSATIDDNIKKLAYKIIHQNAIRIHVSPKNPVARNVEHGIMFIAMDDKRFFLQRLIEANTRAKILVFCRTKIRAERVHKAMERVNIDTRLIHGDIDQINRTAVIEEFREGQTLILIATDVTSRGIDIPDVDIVVNYDLPEEADTYVHRVGRTGRGKKKGQAISFCDPKEKDLLESIETYINGKITVLNISKQSYKETLEIQEEKSIEDLLSEIEEIEKKKKKK